MEPTAPMGHAVIVAGGDVSSRIPLPDRGFVIAADSGYDHALAAGLRVDVLVGDLDSISPSGQLHAEANGVDVLAYPSDKDLTDLEIALRTAVERGATHIDLHGGEGGTVGHLLAGALSLTADYLTGIDLRWHVESGLVQVARPGHPVSIAGPPGTRVTIVPVGDVSGITTTGLRWPLAGASLPAGSTRGVSNELERHPATVEVGAGTALVVAEGP